jgi:kumamolisin
MESNPTAKPGVIAGRLSLPSDDEFGRRFDSTQQTARSSIAAITQRYRLPSNLKGKGECIGILAFGGRPSISDLIRFFEHETGAVPDLRVKNLTPANYPNRNSQHDAETALDIQIAGALAPHARIVIYFSANDEKGWVDAVSHAIHDQENRPSVLSISWGATEDWWHIESMQKLNELFAEAAGRGITVCAATGDDGCATDVHDHCRVTFPASSPFVLACGGTSFRSDGNEVVWNVRNTGASGGGISDRISRPAWQPPLSEVLTPPFPHRRNPGFDGRQLPDVSGLASHSYSVYVGGAYRNSAGGTSASAPLWSALIALLNEGLRGCGLPPIGYFHPRLYGDRSLQRSFRSITVGQNDPFGNHGYHARPGWNFCTGWGSPDGTKLLETLCSQQQRLPKI